MSDTYDFGGWATKNNLLCSDGRTIRKGAFKHLDGKVVPLVWMHDHKVPENVLGHALLECRDEGVYTYGKFNDTERGQYAKKLVQHGDIDSLSIYANGLKHGKNKDVLHGDIREVSLVIAGANPGAYIDSVSMAHGDESYVEDEGIIYTGENLELYHADEDSEEIDEETKEDTDKEEIKHMAEETKKTTESEETVADVFNTFNEKQKTVVYALIGQAVEDAEKNKEDDEDGGEEMKHNVFENDYEQEDNFLSHADQEEILDLAKKSNVGSFKRALEIYSDENDVELMHAASAVGGFIQTTEAGNVTELFPEYKDVRPGAPELITNDQGWVTTVLNKVHKSPISRIRTKQVDIRNIQALRAKGYKKGAEKKMTGNFKLVNRTTDPQTVYVRNALHRDDVIDITDFDYVQYLYGIDKMMLNEELATAIMLGDGREDGDPDKIAPEHIRPIWLDDDLYTIHVDLDLEAMKGELQGTNTGANFGPNFITAEAMVNTILYSREQYRGSGTPDLYITPHMLNVMLLARDMNGRRIYSSKAELASSLNVGNIYTAEQFEGKKRKDKDQKEHKLLAILCNLSDYSLGATKGGQITHFTDFDIDFNQLKSLLETRCSGALTKVYSAIAIEEKVPASDAM